jgi:hypothetical protein
MLRSILRFKQGSGLASRPRSGRIVGNPSLPDYGTFARNPTRIDGKCEDHFLQADFSGLGRFCGLE